jgi:hypothetical protein
MAAIVLATWAAPRPARAVDLATLLRAVERTATFDVPATADLRIETPGTPTATNTLRLAGQGHVVRLEAAGEWRALVKVSKIVVAAMGRPPRENPEATLPGSALLVADFAPFTANMLRVPLISDEGPVGVIVTGEPRPPSPYVLLVYTIDSKRSVVSAAKYYRWEINNLVQMTRVREWDTVGTRPRAKVVDVQEIASGRTSTLIFAWRLRPDLAPALFRPSGLGIPLPAPAAAGP